MERCEESRSIGRNITQYLYYHLSILISGQYLTHMIKQGSDRFESLVYFFEKVTGSNFSVSKISKEYELPMSKQVNSRMCNVCALYLHEKQGVYRQIVGSYRH